MTLFQLMQAAEQAGVNRIEIDAALDGDEPKLMLKTRVDSRKPAADDAMRAKLLTLPLSELIKQATMHACSEKRINECLDEDDPKQLLSQLIVETAVDEIVAKNNPQAADEDLRKEKETQLLSKPLSALAQQATQDGCDDREIAAAMDSDDPKQSLAKILTKTIHGRSEEADSFTQNAGMITRARSRSTRRLPWNRTEIPVASPSLANITAAVKPRAHPTGASHPRTTITLSPRHNSFNRRMVEATPKPPDSDVVPLSYFQTTIIPQGTYALDGIVIYSSAHHERASTDRKPKQWAIIIDPKANVALSIKSWITDETADKALGGLGNLILISANNASRVVHLGAHRYSPVAVSIPEKHVEAMDSQYELTLIGNARVWILLPNHSPPSPPAPMPYVTVRHEIEGSIVACFKVKVIRNTYDVQTETYARKRIGVKCLLSDTTFDVNVWQQYAHQNYALHETYYLLHAEATTTRYLPGKQTRVPTALTVNIWWYGSIRRVSEFSRT